MRQAPHPTLHLRHMRCSFLMWASTRNGLFVMTTRLTLDAKVPAEQLEQALFVLPALQRCLVHAHKGGNHLAHAQLSART